ncbi:hypothetical protein K458DRAFT_441384 [Lentithecium fluviatile CBS 122367]|uniref:N-acetyltransferase domain-containing protein n=1 Tax=Lentithecium fluviatile CBS 122367 TaxID=1168545 RepID=A0A6G1J7K8_9PLEO|nr:hypothetical protein K458DRAFT_441384 [Lentithecium fluviatile CBS 122367]
MATTPPSIGSPVEVSTTQPVPQKLDKFSSERLLFRPLLFSDLPAYREILQEEETMTNAGVSAMTTEHAAQQWFNQMQKLSRVGIFLKKSDGTEGELIGEGGMCKIDNEWPEIFYLLKQEQWGKRYVPEFVEKVLPIWWSIPREQTRIFVQPAYLDSDSRKTSVATERLCATIKSKNERSNRVVERAGFKCCGEFQKTNQFGDLEPYKFWQLLSPNMETLPSS